MLFPQMHGARKGQSFRSWSILRPSPSARDPLACVCHLVLVFCIAQHITNTAHTLFSTFTSLLLYRSSFHHSALLSIICSYSKAHSFLRCLDGRFVPLNPSFLHHHHYHYSSARCWSIRSLYLLKQPVNKLAIPYHCTWSAKVGHSI